MSKLILLRFIVAYLAKKHTNKKHHTHQSTTEIFLDESRKCTFYVLSSHLFWTSDVWTRTSRGRTGGRSHIVCPPSLCGSCLNFYREEDSATPFPRRPGSRILCTHELIVLHLLGMIFFFGRKNPSSCDPPEIRITSQSQKVSRLPTEPSGLPYSVFCQLSDVRRQRQHGATVCTHVFFFCEEKSQFE